jgi:hypothetical protein
MFRGAVESSRGAVSPARPTLIFGSLANRARKPPSICGREKLSWRMQTAAVKRVLIEIAKVPGSFRGKCAVVGAGVPWLLLKNEEMPHVGSMDVDPSLDPKRWATASMPRWLKP